MELDYTLLSKTLSHALRHQPWLYELELDEEGWTEVEALLDALRPRRREWRELSLADLAELISRSEKCRFQIEGGRIRATYGHSVCGRLLKTPAAPPEVLYHGTYPQAVRRILSRGLRPMRRQYVHLSVDPQTAWQVGQRKSQRPVVLKVLAARAAGGGVAFYKGNDKVWLAEPIPPEYISRLNPPSPPPGCAASGAP